MNKVQEFIFNNLGSVRIIPAESGNQMDTLFCANDVLDILGYHPKSRSCIKGTLRLPVKTTGNRFNE